MRSSLGSWNFCHCKLRSNGKIFLNHVSGKDADQEASIRAVRQMGGGGGGGEEGL